MFSASAAGPPAELEPQGDDLVQFKPQIGERVAQPLAGGQESCGAQKLASDIVGVVSPEVVLDETDTPPGSAMGDIPASARQLIDHVRLIGVVGFDRQLRPTNSGAAGMDQIQQTLQSTFPAGRRTDEQVNTAVRHHTERPSRRA